jgi:Asp-tRNA(Asn)/Glu-tRNA(Gln) amidotransferase A subunit family amidase
LTKECIARVQALDQSGPNDGRDPATGGVPLGWRGLRARPTNIPTNYTQFVNAKGLKGARIGITRVGLNGFDSVTTPQPVLEATEASFQALQDAGATIIDLDAQGFVFPPADGEFFVLLYDFKGDVATYFKPV